MDTPRRSPPVAEVTEGGAAVSRAFAILRLLHDHPHGLSQTEIGRLLGAPRSTVARVLAVSRAEGFVASSGSRGSYRLGSEIMRLAAGCERAVAAEVHPWLETLAQQVGETVELYAHHRDGLTLVDAVPAAGRLQVGAAVGDVAPFHASAAGKAFLARQPASDRCRLLPRRLVSYTASTCTNRARLLAEITSLGATDVAVEREEFAEGVCALAVSLPSPALDAVVVVSIAVPRPRFDAREHDLSARLVDFRRSLETAWRD